jgi:hypothetical protein
MRRTAFAIAAAALIAGAISAVPQSPALAAPGATPTISITARSPFAKVTNDVYVRFRLDTMKSATIQGKVVGAVHGEDLRLYAQPFPFKQAPAKVADLAIGSATMPYSFRVTPRLATRYRAKLFRTSSSGTALAASAKVTVYAAATRRARGGSMSAPGLPPDLAPARARAVIDAADGDAQAVVHLLRPQAHPRRTLAAELPEAGRREPAGVETQEDQLA